MRLDDTLPPVPRWTAEAGRPDSAPAAQDRLTAGADAGAWQLEMERAAQDSWHCAATAPAQAATAVDAGSRAIELRPTGSDAAQAHRFLAAPAQVQAHARPYGLDMPAWGDGHDQPLQGLTETGRGMRAALDTNREPGPVSLEADLTHERPTPAASSRAGALSTAAGMMRLEGGSVPDEASALRASPQAPDSAATGAAGLAEKAAHAAQAAPQQAVRLHVESIGEGRLQAWLGVNRGAAPQAQAVLAALRADVRRRGETLSEVRINGQALSPAAFDSLATPADPPTLIPVDSRLPKQRSF